MSAAPRLKSPAAPAPRVYTLRRIGPSDWLWLDDLRAHLWRITTYIEDGSASWTDADGTDHPITGRFWGAWRYNGRVVRDDAGAVLEAPDVIDEVTEGDWNRWDFWCSSSTRRGVLEDVNAETARSRVRS